MCSVNALPKPGFARTAAQVRVGDGLVSRINREVFLRHDVLAEKDSGLRVIVVAFALGETTLAVECDGGFQLVVTVEINPV